MQHILHCLRGLLLGRVLKVRVEVCRGGEVAVTEPFLDHLHRHSVRQKQRSAAMPQIVEADAAKAVLLQKYGKLRRDVPRLNALIDLIDIDVLQIVRVVRPAAELAVVRLLLFELQQLLAERRHERLGAPAGLVLGGVLCDQDRFSVQIAACDRVLDGKSVLVKVEGVPLQADDLAAAQAVEGSEQDRKLQSCTGSSRKELVQLVVAVKAALKLLFLGALHLVGGIGCDHVHFGGVFQRLVDIRVIVDDRCGGYALELVLIEVLNVFRAQRLQRDLFLRKYGAMMLLT